jgi:hypothetical protein
LSDDTPGAEGLSPAAGRSDRTELLLDVVFAFRLDDLDHFVIKNTKIEVFFGRV